MWRSTALLLATVALPDGVTGRPPFTILRTSATQKPIYKRVVRAKALDGVDQQVPRWLIKCADGAPPVRADICRDSGCHCSTIDGFGLLHAECEESALVNFVDERPELEFAEEDGEAEIRLEPHVHSPDLAEPYAHSPDLAEPHAHSPDLAEPHANLALPWNLKRIGLQHANATGKGVRIWILDTGVRATHEDLKGRVTAMGRFLDDSEGGEGPCESNADPRCSDHSGHGTHVAGTAAGSRFGVAKDAEILSVKFIGPTVRPTTRLLVRALNMVLSHRRPGDIVNLSLGEQGYSPVLSVALGSLKRSGVLVVAAAMNSDEDACAWQPAGMGSVLTVGASDVNDTRAFFSNWGECVDLFAPGVQIKSAWSTSDDAYKTLPGTSMAAPHVAGVAALYLEGRKTAEPSEVQQFLLTTAAQHTLKNLKAGDPDRLLRLGAAISAQAAVMAKMNQDEDALLSGAASNASKAGQEDVSSLRGAEAGRQLGDESAPTSGGLLTARPWIALIAVCAVVGDAM